MTVAHDAPSIDCFEPRSVMNSFTASMSRPLTVLALTVAAALPSYAQSAGETAVPVEEFSVFVDMPTGFAFVRTPSGWRFVRQIEANKLGQLHPTTLVSVMQAGERFGQIGSKAAAAASSRVQF